MAEVSGTTISFVTAGSKIQDSGNDLGVFSVGDFIWVKGSEAAQNDGYYRCVSVAAGEIVVTSALVDEAVGETITITSLSSFREIVAAVYLILERLASSVDLLNVNNISVADTRVIDNDSLPKLILYPGDVSEEDRFTKISQLRYEVQIHVIVPGGEEEHKYWRDFMEMREAVITEIQRHPSLAAYVEDHSTFNGPSGCTRVRVSGLGEPEELYDQQLRGNDYEFIGPLGVTQVLVVSVDREEIITGGEFA